MNKFVPVTYEQFLSAVDFISHGEFHETEYLYEVYSNAVDGIDDLSESNIIGTIQGINHLELIGYCLGEYAYFTSNLTEDQKSQFKEDENVMVSIASVVADKYLSLSQFSHQETMLTSRFSPPISTLYVYVNFMLNIVEIYRERVEKPSIIADLFKKSISIAKCTLDLLIEGFETEAFSCWRTLHECECVLILLYKYGDQVINRYLKHMQYGLAFRDTMPDKLKQTEIFNEMKEEMKQYDLKSKDIKKYIEYGWLYEIEENRKDETFKLNFRDGLEKAAGLSQYNKRYEMSSEIIHGTPLLIYSNREYFHYVTLLSTYESFFRLEQIFLRIFSTYVSKEQMDGYMRMRSIYYTQLVNIHKREAERFKHWQDRKRTRKA